MTVGKKNIQFGLIRTLCNFYVRFSSPGRSPGRAIVLPPASASASTSAAASALAKSLMLKFCM